MKYATAFVLAIVAGALTAAALLYVNPLTRQQTVPATDSGWVLSYALTEDAAWLSTHASVFRLPIVPEGVQLPYERGISGTIVAAMPLEDVTNGGGAAATRISIPSGRTDLLRSGVVVDDYWLISVPGQGSLLVRALSNHWPMVRDTVVRVDWLRRDWTGADQYGPTRGPSALGAEVRGLTGRLAGMHGTARERLIVNEYAGRPSRLAGELLLDVSSADE